MIRSYRTDDFPALLALWNSAGLRQGYAPQTAQTLPPLLTAHPYFSPDCAFVLEEDGAAAGFICGCVGEDLPQGDRRGYFTCLLLAEAYETDQNAAALLSALEDAFRRAGKVQAAMTFFNPMRLPWLIPGTPGHQHNNCPGVAEDLPLHRWMTNSGWQVHATECAMYLDLAGFATPDWVKGKEADAAAAGYTVAWYRPGVHRNLAGMVHSLGNPMWDAEIPAAAEERNMLVALRGDEVVGFTGPVYPEPTGRGYFAGIAVARAHEGHGLGTLLFYRLCQAEKEAGSGYMSLFTGSDNHAQRIYLGAGFRVCRKFSVVTKEL